MTGTDVPAEGLPTLPILDGTTLPQHRPPPAKRSLQIYQNRATEGAQRAARMEEIRALVLEMGADDVGFVSVDRDDMVTQKADIEALLPGARTAIAFVVAMNRGNIRTPARSVANGEFHHGVDETNEISRDVASALEARGYRAVSPPGGFPMEVDRFPGKIWTISMKPIAVAAGLGQMGIHRNVIHPKFGNFILIGVVITDLEIGAEEETRPIDWNPCMGCRLCVAACPVGAVKSDGSFDFAACSTHNYREFLGGFSDWVDTVTDSDGSTGYAEKMKPSETASMWQSLSFGANYKAAYCMAVCPAGDDVIGPYLKDQKRHIADVVKPLTEKEEPVYVVAGSDAEAHVTARFSHKEVRRIKNGFAPTTVEAFVAGSPLVFSARAAKGVTLRAHFSFRGDSSLKSTFVIDEGELRIDEGLTGKPDVAVDVDAKTWVGILRGETNPVWAVATRKLKVKGPIKNLKTFQQCFPI